jgi:hypothetical protein
MKPMLVGATGLVGQQVLRQALASPAVNRVIAPTRKALALAYPSLNCCAPLCLTGGGAPKTIPANGPRCGSPGSSGHCCRRVTAPSPRTQWRVLLSQNRSASSDALRKLCYGLIWPRISPPLFASL